MFLSRAHIAHFMRAHRVSIGWTLIFTVTIMLMANWTFSSFIVDHIHGIMALTTLRPLTPTFRSLGNFEISNIGAYCLYFLAILGGLTWLKRLNSVRAAILTGVAGLSLIVHGNVLLGLKAFLPERWFVFLFVLLAPIAAVGYRFLCRILRKEKRVFLLILIFVLTFAMIVSSDSNVDSPIYYHEEFGVRKSLTKSDLWAIQAAASFSNGTLYVDMTDKALRVAITWSFHRTVNTIDFEDFDPKNISGLIIVRRDGYFQPTECPINKMPSAFNKTNNVYSDGEVMIFLLQGGS